MRNDTSSCQRNQRCATIRVVANAINDTYDDGLSEGPPVINDTHDDDLSEGSPVVDDTYDDHPSEGLPVINNTQSLLAVW